MVKYLLVSLLMFIASTIWGQHTATLKISEVNIDLNGEKVDNVRDLEVQLTDQVQSSILIFEQKGIKYGVEFQYKKGKTRIKLVRRGYALKGGLEPKYGKKRKDMQELRTSITGSFNKRVIDNIILSKENLESIYASFKYELIYK